MRAKLLLCGWLSLSSLTLLGQITNTLHFNTAGFSLAALEAPPGQIPHNPLVMSLPATDGFSPNVNVLIQKATDSIDAYADISLVQIRASGYKVLDARKIGTSAIDFEYSGVMNKQMLHWYARTEEANGKLYTVTATCTELQWVTLSSQLKTCVDSLNCGGATVLVQPK